LYLKNRIASASKRNAKTNRFCARQVKQKQADGGCLGDKSRRRTWHTAKSVGEPCAGFEPTISEWGNPAPQGVTAG
jgi:hypothetical protein